MQQLVLVYYQGEMSAIVLEFSLVLRIGDVLLFICSRYSWYLFSVYPGVFEQSVE